MTATEAGKSQNTYRPVHAKTPDLRAVLSAAHLSTSKLIKLTGVQSVA